MNTNETNFKEVMNALVDVMMEKLNDSLCRLHLCPLNKNVAFYHGNYTYSVGNSVSFIWLFNGKSDLPNLTVSRIIEDKEIENLYIWWDPKSSSKNKSTFSFDLTLDEFILIEKSIFSSIEIDFNAIREINDEMSKAKKFKTV